MSHRSSLFFTTPDHVNIVGTFVLPDEDLRGGAVLLHMMPSNRESYLALQELLAHIGIASFAIDLRGHGDSIRQGEKIIDYKNFSDTDHQKSIIDVEGAVEYFCNIAGIPLHSVMLIGASIGANLALNFQVKHSEVTLSILLSPGLSYHGIQTDVAARLLARTQRCILFSSSGDTYSLQTSLALHELDPDGTVVEETDGNEHGTDLFLYGDVVKKIIEYCDQWAKRK